MTWRLLLGTPSSPQLTRKALCGSPVDSDVACCKLNEAPSILVAAAECEGWASLLLWSRSAGGRAEGEPSAEVRGMQACRAAMSATQHDIACRKQGPPLLTRLFRARDVLPCRPSRLGKWQVCGSCCCQRGKGRHRQGSSQARSLLLRRICRCWRRLLLHHRQRRDGGRRRASRCCAGAQPAGCAGPRCGRGVIRQRRARHAQRRLQHARQRARADADCRRQQRVEVAAALGAVQRGTWAVQLVQREVQVGRGCGGGGGGSGGAGGRAAAVLHDPGVVQQLRHGRPLARALQQRGSRS